MEIQKASAGAGGMANANKAVWHEILRPTPTVKRMLIAGYGIQCFQHITGIDATVYYSPTIFKQVGIQSKSKLLAATVVVGFTKTLFILVAIFLIDRVGRKPLLYLSTIGMTTCLFCLSSTLAFLDGEKLGIVSAIAAVCGNVAFFSVGIGPVCWVLSSEIFQASALGAMGSRVSSGLITIYDVVSVGVAGDYGGGTFFVFSLISVASGFWFTSVCSTKGKCLEQIEMVFEDQGIRIRMAEADTHPLFHSTE